MKSTALFDMIFSKVFFDFSLASLPTLGGARSFRAQLRQ